MEHSDVSLLGCLLLAVGFDDSGWPSAVPLAAGSWAPLHLRSIPLLREEKVENLMLVEAKPTAVEPGPLAERLPLELEAGARVVIDCGREVQAYAVLDFAAAAGSRWRWVTRPGSSIPDALPAACATAATRPVKDVKPT